MQQIRQKLAYIMIGLLGLSTVLFTAKQCFPEGLGSRPNPAPSPAPAPRVPQVAVPDFHPDSSFFFVEKQVKFGPRVPNTDAHKKCAAWLVASFKGYGLEVIEQKFQAPHYKGATFNGNNIIAQYRPELPKRILIAAHWDSRFMADHDTKNQQKPIDGADDGASGVGILLELARVLSKNPVDIGVDLICLDLEDQGDDEGEPETWCLGSQYWAKNLHKAGYMPYQAVLLDMVGGKEARFYKEGFSMEVAPRTMDKIWALASSLGYANYFIPQAVPGITDDHYFIVREARIPMVDIISLPNSGKDRPFPTYHHTHDDNLSAIDRNTLKAVGQTMTAFIYQLYNGNI
jgi:glutaminyl-peptide cyclotransferase